MWYIHKGVNRVKPDVIYARRKARYVLPVHSFRPIHVLCHSQAKLNGDGLYENARAAETTDDAIFNPAASDVALAPSDSPYDPPYQRWDKQGRAEGYTSDPRLYAPQPRRVNETLGIGLAARVESTTPTGQPGKRQESSDSVGWDLQATASEPQSFPLRPLPETEPIGPLKNPFESDESPETNLPPSTSPLRPSRGKSDAGYAFGSRQHSFGGGVPPPDSSRVKSPPAYEA